MRPSQTWQKARCGGCYLYLVTLDLQEMASAIFSPLKLLFPVACEAAGAELSG